MSEPHDALIVALAEELRPVRKLLPPWARTACWLGLGLALAGLLVAVARPHRAMPFDLADEVALAAAAATTASAAMAAFCLAIPGRDRRWAALPLIPFLVWVAASVWSCSEFEGDMAGAPTAMSCFRFIVLFAAPITALAYWMLRRAYCLQLVLTSCLAGLAAASMGAVALELDHPHPMPLSDFVAHFGAVLAVVAICRLLLPPLLQDP